jgi:phage/plasmid primase-like uncharacterized protein
VIRNPGLTPDDLTLLAAGRIGAHDVACPMCGPDRRTPSNRNRRVLRVWLAGEKFGTWFCVRCGFKGEAHANGGRKVSIDSLRQAREAARMHEQQSAASRLEVALYLWRRRRPIVGTVAERYLREVRGCGGTLPATLGFLPAQGEHPPSMIAPFGMPCEPEPGRLEIDDKAVMGVHITRLKPDGSGKVPDRAKIMIGRCLGSPIALAPMNDNLGLAITEGIEDALSIHEGTGLGAWAAGAASRLPALAEAVPPYADAVSIIADPDPAGQRFAGELRAALRSRQIRAAVVSLGIAA